MRNQYWSFNLMYVNYFYLLGICNIIDLTLNCIIFIDLYFTLKNPFRKRSSRCSLYWLGSLVILMIVLLILIYTWDPVKIRDRSKGLNELTIPFFALFSFILYVAFISFILVIKRLCMKGTSKNLRK